MTVTNEVLDYSDKLRYLYANSIRNPVFFAENMLQVVVYKHNVEYINAVSYTHLTLPTIYSV